MLNPMLDRGRPSLAARSVAMAACLLLIVVVGSAQTRSSAIAGRVLDETNAVVPGVSITVTNDADEVVGTAISAVSGRFTVSGLLPGTYGLTAEMMAFKKVVRTGIEVGPAQTTERDLTLEIGGLEETVEIAIPTGRPLNTAPAGDRRAATDVAESNAEIDRRVGPCSANPPPPPPASASGPVRVGGSVRAPRKLIHVNPVYPAAQANQGIGGIVILEGRLNEYGEVDDVQILRDPNPGLSQAAIDAVSQWQFTQTLLNGCAVPVIMTVTVNFNAGN